MDPACYNHKLEKHAGSSDWAVLQLLDFKVTSRVTHQHNGLAELAFPYLAGTALVVLGSEMVHDDRHGKVSLEATISCATQLDGLVMIKVNAKIAP